MVYITGDTHGDIDIHKLAMRNFPQQKYMSKNDSLIVCGDFGCVWDGSKCDRYWQKWYDEKSFTTLFVDGNHENHRMLAEFPIVNQYGGSVHQIQPSLFHLMRGEVFEIDGAKVFCMGGASSHDKHLRKPNISWWEEEIPSKAEFEHAVETLEKHNWCVDYIVTHCASKSIQAKIASWYENDAVTSFLQFVEENCRFKHWYFGHYHVDLDIDDRHTALYRRVLPLGGV